MQRYSPELDRIKQMLRHNRRGLSITDISRKIGINRNSVAKYLDVLQMAGDVEVKKVCTAKLYFISDRVPLSDMLSLTSDAILVLNAMGGIDYANPLLLEIEGWRMFEIVGKKLSDVSSTLIDEELIETISSLSPGEIFEKEIEVKTGDGSQIFRTKCVGTVLPDGGSATTLIFEDITQKRECQARLRLKEALYRAVVEDQEEFIIRYRPDRTITFVNDAYCRAFGIDRLEVIGTVFAPSIPSQYQQGVTEQLSGLTPDEPVVSFENPVIMPDGNEAWHQWTNRGIFADSGKLVEYQSVGRDITDQVRIQKAKDELLKELTMLSDYSTGLVLLSDDDDISVYVGGALRKAAPSSLILFFSFHDGIYHFQEVVDGKYWCNASEVNCLNDLKGRAFSCPFETAKGISSVNIQSFSGGYADSFRDAFADSAGEIFRKLLQQYDCMSMGIIAGNNLMGTCLIFTGNEENPRLFALIESMINQAAVMLQNRYMLQSMKLTENRYENLLDESVSMIGIHVGGIIVYLNPRLREFLGIEEGEELGEWLLSTFLHPDDLELVAGRMFHVYSNGTAAPPIEERLIDTNGCEKKVLVFSLPTVYRGKLGGEFIVHPL